MYLQIDKGHIIGLLLLYLTAIKTSSEYWAAPFLEAAIWLQCKRNNQQTNSHPHQHTDRGIDFLVPLTQFIDNTFKKP